MKKKLDSGFTHEKWRRCFSSSDSKLEMKCNVIVFYLLGVLVFVLLDLTGLKVLGPIFGTIISKYILPINDNTVRVAFGLVSLIFGLSGMSFLVVPNLIFWGLYDQGLMKESIRLKLKSFLNVLQDNLDAMTPYSSPLFGVNSNSVFDDLVFLFWVKIEKFGNYLLNAEYLEFDVRAEYLREIAKSVNVVDIVDRPHLLGSGFMAKVKSSERKQKIGMLLVTTVLGALALRQPIILTVIAAYIFNRLAEIDVSRKRQKRKVNVKDGIYQVSNYFFGLPLSYGIGVSVNGVLHVPYHVCKAQPIVLGSSSLTAYYVSIDEDVVTYGGPPCFVKPKDGQRVFVNTETPRTTVTYTLSIERDDDEDMFAWTGVTKPGESGSPVFGIDENGGIELYGLAGRYYKNSEGITEFAALASGKETTLEVGKVEKVILGPGKGKTTRVMRNSIAKFLRTNPDKKVLVAGPTRAVCREISRALGTAFSVSLNIKGERLRNPRAPVQVCSHHTALAMSLKGDKALIGLGYIIIDEAHMNDYSTKCLRKYANHFVEMGGKATEMSATLDGVCDSSSNYPIINLEYKQGLEKVIEEYHDGINKILVFVHSIKNEMVRSLYKKYPGSVLLSRETYMNTIEMVNDEATKLIFTTNISECGLNIPDLDVVIDTGNEFTYVEEGGVIGPVTRNISEASMIQRRGRVGRFKKGIYVRDFGWTPSEDSRDVSQIEADILCSGRDWSPDSSNSFGIYLSDWQVNKALEDMLSPIETYLKYDHVGRARDKASLSLLISRLRKGDTVVAGCNLENCSCRGSWKWFDMRIHDLMVGDYHSAFLYE